jgi:hypothetical protein
MDSKKFKKINLSKSPIKKRRRNSDSDVCVIKHDIIAMKEQLSSVNKNIETIKKNIREISDNIENNPRISSRCDAIVGNTQLIISKQNAVIESMKYVSIEIENHNDIYRTLSSSISNDIIILINKFDLLNNDIQEIKKMLQENYI